MSNKDIRNCLRQWEHSLAERVCKERDSLLRTLATERDAWGKRERKCVNDHASLGRISEWLDSGEEPRKPANLAFTEGPDRQIAYVIEALTAKLADRDAKTERLEKALKDIRDEAAIQGDECWWQDIRNLCKQALSPDGEGASK